MQISKKVPFCCIEIRYRLIDINWNVFSNLYISAAQKGETEDQPKVPKRSLSVRYPRKKPYQKHKREGSEPFVPPPPPVSYSGKYSQPPSSPDSVAGSDFSPRLGRKQNRSLAGSRDNLLTKSFRAMATQLRPKVFRFYSFHNISLFLL